jgi:TPR repeat protein
MFRYTHRAFSLPNRLVGSAVLFALITTSACSRTSSPAETVHAADTQSPAQHAVRAANPPSSDLSPQIADARRAAEAGNIGAMTTLANACEKGEGAPQDSQLAISWFTKAAEAGDSKAMYRLGRIYATGSGVEKDYVEAFNWYRRAAKAGNTDAMYALGEAYEHGTGVREDIQQAVNWYDQATIKGNKAAKAALDRLGEDFDR